MADLTGKLIADSYKNLLQAPGPNNDGLASGQSITIQDGSGNSSGLALSQAGVALTGTINIQGSQFTGTGAALNTAVANAGTFVVGVVAQNGAQSFGRTLTASTGVSISNANGTSGNPTFSLADSGVTSATYGPTTMLNIDSTGRVISTETTAVLSATTFEGSNVNAQFGNFTTDVSVGGQLRVTGSFQPTNISTSIVSATNIAASVATINNLTVNGNVSAIALYGDGSNLTGIVAASATNASYAASAGEAAVAVSAHHASSATFATSADTANFATTATNASFAISATNATNATSAVFASSATNATTAITVNYGGVVQTSTANIGDVSASSLFVSGNVSANGTLNIGGQVSIDGGLKVIGDVSAGNIRAGGIIYGDGAGLFNVPSAQGGTVNFVKGGTGLHVTIAGTTTTNPITASGTLALNADQSFGTVSATSFVLAGSGALITDTSATALVTALSATMATSIDNSNTNITANANAITALSATMATSIDNTNTNLTALSATMATSIANHLPLAGGTMTGAITLPGNPSANLEAATKQYVDNLTAAAIHFHDAVRLESPVNLNGTYNNGTAGVGATLTNAGTQAALVIDGVSAVVADRVLLYQQTDQTQNGIYTVTDIGSGSTNWVLTRATDADTYAPGTNSGLDEGSYFYVQEGDTGAGESYVCNTIGTITFGTTNITFIQFSSALVYSAGSGININASRVISTSGVATNTALTALSATLATSIGNSNTLIAATSVALATSIGNTNANVTTNINAITSINSILGDGTGFATDAELAAVSAALATSIGNTNSNVTTNTNAITSINSKIATVSSTLATSIGNTNSNVTTNINAITSINSKITAVSGSLATSISTVNNRVTTLSATFATSIANQNQTITAGNGLTGGGSGNVTLNVGAGTGITVNANDIAIGQAVGTGNSVTFAGVNINGNLNAVDDIYLADQIIHEGDTDTYIQFHAANQWRVVTGGTEMLEVNDSYILAGSNTVGKVETASKTGSVTPNLYVYNSFVWTLTGNITLNNPSTEVTGMSGVFIFIHSGAARTVSLGTDWETAGAAGLTLSSTSGAVDMVPYYVQSSGNILLGTPMLAFS
jgi:hypothetical protein